MTDIIGEIAALLDRHGELEDCEGACECGYIGVGHREGWNWHVARVLAAELKLGHLSRLAAVLHHVGVDERRPAQRTSF